VRSAVLIVGGGGFGRSVADAITAAGQHAIAGFLDDRWPDLSSVLGHAVLGRVSSLPQWRDRVCGVVVAIGDNTIRAELFLKANAAGMPLVTVTHPAASLSAHARIGAGSLVMAGAIIGTEAELGMGCLINAGAVVDHHAKVGAFAHLGVGACMASGAELGEGAWLREGVVLRARVQVPPGAIVE
jgi:sugar O-acyltransferase (sialic acid O-acetyltransferase NeuD family)